MLSIDDAYEFRDGVRSGTSETGEAASFFFLLIHVCLDTRVMNQAGEKVAIHLSHER